eukprot:4247293-Prymnesium_polylepis.1
MSVHRSWTKLELKSVREKTAYMRATAGRRSRTAVDGVPLLIRVRFVSIMLHIVAICVAAKLESLVGTCG